MTLAFLSTYLLSIHSAILKSQGDAGLTTATHQPALVSFLSPMTFKMGCSLSVSGWPNTAVRNVMLQQGCRTQ